MTPDARGLPDDSVNAARVYFPRGLVQPPGSFRFSADALLLAAFASRCLGRAACSRSVLELGTGCGVVSLSFLLNMAPDVPTQGPILGIEIDQALVKAATENARQLGLSDSFHALCADVGHIRELDEVGPESRDVVLANPPYRDPKSGRLPRGKQRTTALFADKTGFEEFFRAASYALRTRGCFFSVLGADRLQIAMECLAQNRLVPKRLKPVYGTLDKDARIVLVEARKNGRPGLVLEAPLVLYHRLPSGSYLTPHARAFCPALECNAVQYSLSQDSPQNDVQDGEKTSDVKSYSDSTR